MVEKIFRSCLNLRFSKEGIEKEFQSSKDKVLRRYIKYHSLTNLFLACMSTILASIYFPTYRDRKDFWATTLTSYVINFVYLIIVIISFKAGKSRTVRILNYLNYYLITFVFISLRYSFVNWVKIDIIIFYAMNILELIVRISWIILGMLGFFESSILNAALIATNWVYYLPIQMDSSSIYFLLANMLAYIILIVLSYFYEVQSRRSVYFLTTLEMRNDWLENILQSMNGGFVSVKKGQIVFMNKYLTHSLERFSQITCEDLKVAHINDTTLCKDSLAYKTNSDRILRELLSNLTLDLIHLPNDAVRLDHVNLTGNGIVNVNVNANVLEHDRSFSRKDTLLNATSFFTQFTHDLVSTQQKYATFTLIGTKTFKNYSLISKETPGELSPENSISFEIYCRKRGIPCDLNDDDVYENDEYEFLFNDVTRTKIIEENNALFKCKTLFLSKVVHEFKNPLICISELVNQLQDSMKLPSTYTSISNSNEGNEQVRTLYQHLRYLQLPQIKSLADYLLILVKDFDYFSQIQFEKKIELDMTTCDLKNVLSFCQEIGNSLLKKSGKLHVIKMRQVIPLNLPRKILTDELRLKQVLINLLSNSIKFTETGTITLELSNEMKGSDKWLRFAVKDTGIGIREDEQEQLFMPFKKRCAGNTIGTGLGLAIVADITSRLGERVTVESNGIGKGSVFSFSLPIESIKSLESSIASIVENTSNFNLEKSKRKISNERMSKYFQEDHRDRDHSHFSSNCNISKSSERTVVIDTFHSFKIIDNFPYVQQVRAKSSNIFEQKGRSYDPKKKSSSRFHSVKNVQIYNNEVILSSPISNRKSLFKPKNALIHIEKERSENNSIIIHDNSIPQDLIIVVDDDMLTRKSLIRSINSIISVNGLHFRIIEAEDGAECLYYIYQSYKSGIQVSYIFSDKNMNYIDGCFLSKIIAKCCVNKKINHIPFFLVTGENEEDYSNSFLCKEGIQNILTKPLEIANLRKLLVH